MATKSDLGQKLLQDLRLRKERMAAAQNYGNSHSTSRGGYANAGQPHRGSQQIKTLESVGTKTRNSHTSGRGNRSFNIQESSGQVVPYGDGKVQSSGKIDLSMAIAFAIENRGEFTKLNSSGNNPILGFLHQVGQKSLDLGKMERASFDMYHPSSSQFVTLSNVQVNEISKGIQKINQILKVCSNGVNFDRYSVEVGKELLKGAMDLETSLRMLVNLQESSNYATRAQRKNRITLLDEDEDDDNNDAVTPGQNQLDLPRFSFDKPSRKSYSKKESRTSEQRFLALTYPEETLIRPNEKKPLRPSNMATSHKRSSSVPDFKALSTDLEPKNQTKSSTYGAGKGRISNVIAKLMGLDELPQNTDLKASRLSSTKKKDTQLTSDSENKPPHSIDKKTKQTKNMMPSQDILKDENGGSAMVAADKISHQEVKLSVKQNSSSSPITTTTTAKHQSDINQIPGNFLKKEREPTNNGNISSQTTDKKELAKQKLEVRKPNGSQVEARIPQTSRNKAGSVQKRKPTLNQAQSGKTKKKASHIEIQRTEASKSIGGLEGRKGIPKPKAGLLKQQLPILHVKKQVKHNVDSSSEETGKLSEDNSEEPKGNIYECERQEVGDKPLDASEETLHCETAESCDIAGEVKCRNQEVLTSPISNGNHKDAMGLCESKHKDVEQQLESEQNPEINSQNTLQNPQRGHQEISKLFQDEEIKIVTSKISENPPGQMETGRRLSPKQQNHTFVPATHEPLTESEKNLKESLIKSHMFLSTAEALLKLNLPISVLHTSDHINQDAECNKLTADCGYEVMRRKAMRQELSLHPCAKISFSYIKVRSLDDLIKQLRKDFDKLNSYGGEEYDSAQYFQNMLEKDMQNRDPDINSMWDFGWEEAMFAFLEKDGIEKDVEKHLINGLIDEITIDLL